MRRLIFIPILRFFSRFFAKISRKRLNYLDTALEMVYQDANGKRWYAYRDPLSMPILRQMAISQAQEMARLKLTSADLSHILDQIIEAAQSKNFANIVALAFDTKTRMELNVEEKTLSLLASVFFLAEDEPASVYDSSWSDKKLAYWRSNPGCMDFFLHAAAKDILNSPINSIQDLREYLRQTSLLLREIRQPSLKP